MSMLRSIVIFMVISFAGLVLVACGGDDDDNEPSDDDDSGDDDTGGDDESPEDTWTDSSTGLMWQNGDDHGYDLDAAVAYCENLDWAGYGDWRLPTISELRTLIRGCPGTETGGDCNVTVDCASVKDCYDFSCGGCPYKEGPGLEGRYWPDDLAGEGWWYCSTTTTTDITMVDVWVVDFYGASVYFSGADYGYQVRCVR